MSGVEEIEEQFTLLFRRHYDEVLRYALRRTEPASAADVASEVFLVAWRRLEEMPTEPLPWLIGTARLVLANQQRSRRRAERLQLKLDAQRPGDNGLGIAQGERHHSSNRGWSAAFQSLSAADQEVLALVAWDGLTAREAAASLGCSVSAFTMRLHRARRRLTAQRRATTGNATWPEAGATSTEVTP